MSYINEYEMDAYCGWHEALWKANWDGLFDANAMAVVAQGLPLNRYEGIPITLCLFEDLPDDAQACLDDRDDWFLVADGYVYRVTCLKDLQALQEWDEG